MIKKSLKFLVPLLLIATGIFAASGGNALLDGTTGTLISGTTAVTQAATDNSTAVASTAYVTTGIANAIAAVNPAVAVKCATTAASDTSGLTYTHVAGIGDLFTGSVNTAITFDGVTLTAVNQRVLIKNDTQSPSGAFNGIYYLSQLQTGILPPILVRALDFDQSSDINNTGAIPVVSGTVNGTTSWVVTSSVTTVGTDPVTFTQFSLNPTAVLSPSIGGTGTAISSPTQGKILTSNGTNFVALPYSMGWIRNLAVVKATTTNTNDSVKYTSADGTALSSTNWAEAYLMDPTAPGTWKQFIITADVTLKLSGATWPGDTLGNTTGSVIRAGLDDDNGTLRYCANYLSGRTSLLTTDTNATPASVTSPEGVLCNIAVGSSTNSYAEIGYGLADFTDSSNVWALETGVNAVVTGRSGDGIWQPCNSTLGGYSGTPTVSVCKFMQDGRAIFQTIAGTGTSNLTTTTFTAASKILDTGTNNMTTPIGTCVDNSAQQATYAAARIDSNGTNVVDVYKDGSLGNWTNTGTKGFKGTLIYQPGPSASFP